MPSEPSMPRDLLTADRDRVAIAMSDTVVRRLFTVGLALENALGLMDGHPVAGKLREAIAELDLAIRDIRHVIFDSQPARVSAELSYTSSDATYVPSRQGP